MIGFMGFGKVLHIFCQNNGLLSFQDAPRINPNRFLCSNPNNLTIIFIIMQIFHIQGCKAVDF